MNNALITVKTIDAGGFITQIRLGGGLVGFREGKRIFFFLGKLGGTLMNCTWEVKREPFIRTEGTNEGVY